MISRIFSCKSQQIYTISISCDCIHFTLKTCQTVAGIRYDQVISRVFHPKFWRFFLQFTSLCGCLLLQSLDLWLIFPFGFIQSFTQRTEKKRSKKFRVSELGRVNSILLVISGEMRHVTLPILVKPTMKVNLAHQFRFVPSKSKIRSPVDISSFFIGIHIWENKSNVILSSFEIKILLNSYLISIELLTLLRQVSNSSLYNIVLYLQAKKATPLPEPLTSKLDKMS